jgi:uncharacterized integral membrane protein (TIGR00698 family)
VALTGRVFGGIIPLLTPLVLAIAIGAIIANTVGLPTWTEPGVEKHSILLETAIVLLGASLSLDALVTAGPLLVVLVGGIVIFGIVAVLLLAQAVSLNDRLGSLLAAGSSICGVSAIAAVAPAIDAKDSQIAHAAATVLAFDVLTLVLFPVASQLLHLDAQFYGIWIGLSMFSTGPVAAAGFAHSAVAGQWATLTKLARNALIGVVAVWFSLRNARRSIGEADPTVGRIWTDFPKFLIGFLLLAGFANTGFLSSSVVSSLSTTSDTLFLLAFAGLGFEIRLADMKETGIGSVLVVGTYLIVVSSIAYVLVSVLF